MKVRLTESQLRDIITKTINESMNEWTDVAGFPTGFVAKKGNDWKSGVMDNGVVMKTEEGSPQRMASQTIQAVYLETVEETRNQVAKSDEAGHSGILRQNGGQQPESLLVHGGNHHREKSYIKRKAHTRRIF